MRLAPCRRNPSSNSFPARKVPALPAPNPPDSVRDASARHSLSQCSVQTTSQVMTMMVHARQTGYVQAAQGDGDKVQGEVTAMMRLRARAMLVVLAVATLAVPARAADRALVLEIDGAIGPPIADYIVQELRAVKPDAAGLVILRMNTPGGLDSSM